MNIFAHQVYLGLCYLLLPYAKFFAIKLMVNDIKHLNILPIFPPKDGTNFALNFDSNKFYKLKKKRILAKKCVKNCFIPNFFYCFTREKRIFFILLFFSIFWGRRVCLLLIFNISMSFLPTL